MTRRFLVWVFWYFLGAFLVIWVTPDDSPIVQVYVWGSVAVLLAWWAVFLRTKYRGRGKVRYAVWGGYGLFLVLWALGALIQLANALT